ncbi:MAG TPA: hypothetical protein VJT85_04900 [Gemmatimonadaceae bacterium]|nr:hypothetical protein [Gemmatimonadaceae bacterium]
MCRKTFAAGAAVGASAVSRESQATLPLIDSAGLLPAASAPDARTAQVESAELGSGASGVSLVTLSHGQFRSTRQFMLTTVFR